MNNRPLREYLPGFVLWTFIAWLATVLLVDDILQLAEPARTRALWAIPPLVALVVLWRLEQRSDR